MNLSAYDSINNKIDKNKSWVDIKKKQLLSREINKRQYSTLVKRYDAQTNTNSYYVAITDTPPKDNVCKKLKIDDYGRVKLNLTPIWNETYLSQLDSNCNIMIERVEHDSDCDIYFIDV